MRIHHRWPMDSPHKGPVMRKAFSYHDVITSYLYKSMINSLTTHTVSRNSVHDPGICSDEEYSKLLYQNLSRLMLFECAVINLLPSDVLRRNMNMLFKRCFWDLEFVDSTPVLIKRFVLNWSLLCCRCTETCFRVSAIQNGIVHRQYCRCWWPGNARSQTSRNVVCKLTVISMA